jgi:hypothetical protein
VVHLGGVCVSLHDGWRALLGGTLPVLPSAGRALPRCHHCGEDSVSTLVTDISKAACSFSCVMRPGFLVYSAVLSYVLVHATDILLTVTFPSLPVPLEHLPSASPPIIPSDPHPAPDLLAPDLFLLVPHSSPVTESNITHATRPSEPCARGHDYHRLHSACSARSCRPSVPQQHLGTASCRSYCSC